MAITVVDAEATVGNSGTIPLSVGSGFQPGDLRVVKIARSTGDGLGAAPAGWSQIHGETAQSVSRYSAVFTRVLQDGDTDDSVTRAGGPGGWAESALTLRGWQGNPVIDVDGYGGDDQDTATAPSITAPGNGLLLAFLEATVLDQEAQGGPLDPPPGMTLEASSWSDGPMGYNVVTASEQVSSGSTGDRSTTFANGVGGWSGMAMFIAEDDSGEPDPDPEPGRFFLAL